MQDFPISISIYGSVCNEKRKEMKITFYLITMFVFLHAPGFCQADCKGEPIKVTLCELAENPDQYIGKRVQVRAFVIGSDEIWLRDAQTCTCYMGIIAVLTDDTKPRPDFVTKKDESFKKFIDDLNRGMNVLATFEGRFEAVYTFQDKQQIWINGSKNKKKGFGKKGEYGGRIILHRISDVLSRPVPRL